MRQNNTPLIVGRIGGVYGVRGWLKISSFTRPEENIFSYSPWLLTINNIFQEIGFDEFQKHGERFLVKFLGIDSPEDASQYVNCDIAISEEQLPRLKKGEYYWRDLIALKVLNKDGFLYFEINENYGPEIVEFLDQEGFVDIELKKDINEKDRMIKAVWK